MILTKLKTTSLVILSTVFAGLATVSCESSTTVEDYVGVQSSDPYDPSKPVTVTKFTPTKGSVGQQIFIAGNNFGNDSSLVNVTIGGKPATVVSVKNNAIYCYLMSDVMAWTWHLTGFQTWAMGQVPLTEFTSLLFALFCVGLIYLTALPLYRKKIFLKL